MDRMSHYKLPREIWWKMEPKSKVHEFIKLPSGKMILQIFFSSKRPGWVHQIDAHFPPSLVGKPTELEVFKLVETKAGPLKCIKIKIPPNLHGEFIKIVERYKASPRNSLPVRKILDCAGYNKFLKEFMKFMDRHKL